MNTTLGFAAALARRAESKGPIRIGLAGAGQMGTDIVVQCGLMTGVTVAAVAELHAETALAACELAGWRRAEVVRAESGAAIDAAAERGAIAVTESVEALCAASRLDVIVDATGNPGVGTQLALSAIRAGKHVVMLNVEADITVGRYLKQAADAAGVIYTGAAGDEPAAVLELIGFAQSLGLEIVAAGKGKNNPMQPQAVPADYAEEAATRDMSPRMLVEFVDGSKTMIEMTAVANATGLVPDVPGMHGPAVSAQDLAQVLCPGEDGGILSQAGCVDFSVGSGVAPGVFCIVRPRHPRIAERLSDLKVGPGPCYALVRPYHLTSIEVPLTAARAVLDGRPDMTPLDRPVADCVAVAKRDLTPGERLGQIGEGDYRGLIMTWDAARARGALPLGLAEGARVQAPIPAGTCLTETTCTADPDRLITAVRRELDSQNVAGGPSAAAAAR